MVTPIPARGTIARPGRPQLERAPEQWPFCLHENPRARRYLEWIVAHHAALGATDRLVFRVLLLYLDGELTRACSASPQALARRASLSPATVRAVLRRLAKAGLVCAGGGLVEVRVAYDDEVAGGLRRLWARSAKLWQRWIYRAVEGRAPWMPAEDALMRLRHPALYVGDGDDDETEEAYAARCAAAEADCVPRFAWIRELVDWGNFARPVVRRSGAAVVKAVALAVELLMDSDGRPFRWTTVAEVARWAGYREVDGVRAALRGLERGGWLGVQRQRGRGGGLLLWLTVPPLVRERWARDAEGHPEAAVGGERR